MGKRTIFECDLCKSDFDESETFKISIAKAGKRNNNKWDLCPECAEDLQSRLVSSEPPRRQRTTRSRRDLEDDEQVYDDSDDALGDEADLDDRIREARRRRRDERPQDDEEILDAFTERAQASTRETPQLKQATGDQKTCSHANRTNVYSAQLQGDTKPRMYTRCKECKLVIPYRTALQKKAFTETTVGKEDIRVGANAAMKRKENRGGGVNRAKVARKKKTATRGRKKK